LPSAPLAFFAIPGVVAPSVGVAVSPCSGLR